MSGFGHTVAPLSPRRVRLVAAGLFVGTVAILLATLDMGYTRDESFYFRYAMSYQEWFVQVEEADGPEAVERVFSRDPVVTTWIGNFEHPPLMKTLFGLSWRALARKDRDANDVRKARGGSEGMFRVAANPADGFAVGARVALLAPLGVAQRPTDPARQLATGVVTERHRHDAIVRLDDDADVGAAVEACRVRAGDREDGGDAKKASVDLPSRWVTGCQAREERTLDVLSEATAMRLPALVFSGLAVMLTFLLGVELFGWLAGLFGAVAFLFVPRHFFHAHMCAFDMPIVAATLGTLYAFWRARDDRRWALAAGFAWGVALLTKHNAFFIPFALVLWWLWTGRDGVRFGRRGRFGIDVSLPPLPMAFLVMPVIALPMLFSFWPKLWYDPMRAIRDYFAFHLDHEHYMQWFFGQPLQVPPFPVRFPFVLTAETVPLVFLALGVIGFLLVAPPSGWGIWLRGVLRRRPVTERERAVAYALFNGLVPIAVIALPSTPIFGGIKHWMTGMPLLLLLAGYGLQQVVRALPAPRLAGALVAVAIFAQPVTASIDSAPYGTGYYNALVAGGIQGAADKQMMRMFWGHTTLQSFDWLNRFAPRNARVFFQNTTWDAYAMYQREGLLRSDIRYANNANGAQIALIEPQKAFAELDLDVRKTFGVAGPYREVRYYGVPFLEIYVRPELLRAGPEPSTEPEPEPEPSDAPGPVRSLVPQPAPTPAGPPTRSPRRAPAPRLAPTPDLPVAPAPAP
ncbi:MAG: phospholipid carrier-dependent glycosyltransferase [Deltaproteobacteria bacterium]|nr:MAG: phospholipid carrier-dependent glycosyltransferase [Deltaproteobacteria bacterium]